MARVMKYKWVLPLISILMALLLLSQAPTGSEAASVDVQDSGVGMLEVDQAGRLPQGNLQSSGPQVPSACPPNPAGLDQTIDRTNYCVYYSLFHATTNPNGITAAEATTAADFVQDYWDRYTTDFGFTAPLISDTKLEVQMITTSDCNGSAYDNYIKVYNGCFDTPESIQKVIGHELFHRVQFGYDSDWDPNWDDIAWLYEGTARASEDLAFTNIDNWPTCLTAVSSSFNKQVNTYLAAPNNDITTWDMRYNSCLWWKYFSEQYGTTPGEPQLGIDAYLRLWQNANAASGIASVNQALTTLGASTTFNTAFRQFILANWTKDLSGAPDASYNYVDEDQVGNCAPYGPVLPHNGGTINIGSPATWAGNDGLGVPYSQVRRYAARYYSAQPGANCPIITASFHKTGGSDEFYHVITQKGNTFDTHREGSGTDWSQSFVNDGVTQIVAIAGAQANSAQVEVTLSCADPDIDIKMPNSGAPAQVQSNTKFLAQVLVTNGSPTGPVVAGLTNSDFSAQVGGVNAAVTGGGFIQEQYWLVIRAPSGLADGTHDLEVRLEEPGTSTVIDTDTEPDAVEFTSDLVDHVLVIDRSGSMGTPLEDTDAKLMAAKDAADFYVDITRNNDGLAVVAYNHDVAPDPFDMVSVNATERTNAKNFINDWSEIYADGATSIGDGLYEARNQRVGSTTGNPRCSFVLLSDGMENYDRYWSTGTDPARPYVQATGCPVTTIAFGPASNETLMQTIASDTGGLSYYNDVYVSSSTDEANATTVAAMTLGLVDTYEYAQGGSEGRQRLLAEAGLLKSGQTNTHTVMIDDSVTEVVFALDWFDTSGYYNLDLVLVKPDGTVYADPGVPYTFADYASNHVGWRIPYPPTTTLEAGLWKLVVRWPYASTDAQILAVPYNLMVSAHTDLTLDLLLPDRLGTRVFTGNRFPIYAILSNRGPIPCEGVEATVLAPDGTQTVVPLLDDGMHDDGGPGDGVCAGWYTKVNQATQEWPRDEGGANPEPDDEGGYRVGVHAMGADWQREAKGAFAVTEGPDANSNGIPDGWEQEHGVSDPNGDPDLDYLFNGDEYLAGTDPNNSDTDGGGENDGSEVDWSQDPLDPSDDQIEAPDSFQAAPQNGSVRLTYDVKTEYWRMELWRAPSPDGPWNLWVADLPHDGAYVDSDSTPNGTTQYYRLIAEDGAVTTAEGGSIAAPGHRSAVLDSEPVTPSIDPLPPEARVIINDGAPSTIVRDVTLTFEPYEGIGGDGTETFNDIVEMIISNQPTFAGASWQPFAQGVPWTLGGPPDDVNKVYVRFKDDNDNESTGTEVGTIIYDPFTVYLPMSLKDYD